MIPHQWLVGGVAIVLGALSLLASLTNHEWFFQLNKLRLLERALGRQAARWICALLGCGLLVLGGCIIAGYLPRNLPSGSTLAPAGSSR
jgi:hypothetical protein